MRLSVPDGPSGPSVSHLIPFSTFLPFVVSTFEEAIPSGNRFMVYGSGDLARYALPPQVRVEMLDTDSAGLEGAKVALAESRIAVIHSMSTFSAMALAATPSSTLRVWSGWGGEYYGSRLNPTARLLGRATARLERGRTGLRDKALNAYSSRYVDQLYRAAAAATDVFSAPVPTDFPVFRRRFPGFRGRYGQLNYASVENTYGTLPDRVSGQDILVGNSATPENNHLEVFQRLAALNLGSRRVIVPLSYGNVAYAADVVRSGTTLFGSQFVPLRDFLPLEEYNSFTSSCGIVVMGHRRQQALGNVARAVWQGANVYMDRRSPLYSYLQAVGIEVFSLEDLRDGDFSRRSVGTDQLDAVRGVARTLWGREAVLRNIRNILDLTAIDGQ